MAFLNEDIALGDGEVSTKQLFEAQAHVWNQIFSFINSMCLKYVVQLGIPDIIHNHGKPITLSQLVQLLPINKAKSQYISRLMRVLVQSKIFVKLDNSDDEEKVCYWLTPSSRLLLRDAPLTVAPLVQLILDPLIMAKPWNHISEWLATEDHVSPFDMAHGETIWGKIGHEPMLSSLFHKAMESDSRLVTGALVRDYKHAFEGIESLVDVGGGTGTTAMAIANAFPDIKCVVLDLPHVVEGLKGTDNLTYIGGDMFGSIPNCDAIILKWILHDWDDESCVKILKKCKDAIPSKDKGGKVMIIDEVVGFHEQGDNTIMENQLFCDMIVMTYYNGKERSEREFEKLFNKAGFTCYKITPAFGVRSLIEVYPN
ncbi:hypothetical protein ACS0TY_017666 [Phlomoides rotata]